MNFYVPQNTKLNEKKSQDDKGNAKLKKKKHATD